LRVVFAGTPPFAARALEAIVAAGHHVPAVLSQPDRPAGRGMRLASSAVALAARELGIEVMKPATLRQGDAASRLAALAPEVMVVAAYGLILPAQVLASLPTGQALLSIAGVGAHHVRIPFIDDPYRTTPRFATKKEDTFAQALRRHPAFATPEDALGDHAAFLRAWLAQLNALPDADAQATTPAAPTSPLAPGANGTSSHPEQGSAPANETTRPSASSPLTI
jgi:hypothetical protein